MKVKVSIVKSVCDIFFASPFRTNNDENNWNKDANFFKKNPYGPCHKVKFDVTEPLQLKVKVDVSFSTLIGFQKLTNTTKNI